MDDYDPHAQAARLSEATKAPILVVQSKLTGRTFITGQDYPAIGLEPVTVLAIYTGATDANRS
jgi:hypothetical protein